MDSPTVLIVPGLRDHVDAHWQTLLAAELPHVRCVAPMGRTDVRLQARVDAIERAAQAVEGPVVIVAHSAGTWMVAHWARLRSREVLGALMVTPPDLETPLPQGYPSIAELRVGGWLPLPDEPLPFRTMVLASRNDPLAKFHRVNSFAAHWRADMADLGEVGHMNPASGFGHWRAARTWIDTVAAAGRTSRKTPQGN